MNIDRPELGILQYQLLIEQNRKLHKNSKLNRIVFFAIIFCEKYQLNFHAKFIRI